MIKLEEVETFLLVQLLMLEYAIQQNSIFIFVPMLVFRYVLKYYYNIKI